MKTYYLTLSKVFPSTHAKAGMNTCFEEKLRVYKLHTIRANYDFWKKRFEKIAAGEACLSVREWTGAPYRSKQKELARLTRLDGIGLQILKFPFGDINKPDIVGGNNPTPTVLSHNDGLSELDWRDWFSGYDLTQPLAVIHFTKFRY